MITAMSISSYVTKSDQKRLLACCEADVDVDQFFDDMLEIIGDQIFSSKEMGPIKLSGLMLDKAERAAKLRCVPEVERQIKLITEHLEDLAPQVVVHISKSENGYDSYVDVLSALKKPYVKKKRLTLRQQLIEDIIPFLAKYRIEISGSLNGNLSCVLQIVCDAAGVSHDVDHLVIDINKKYKSVT